MAAEKVVLPPVTLTATWPLSSLMIDATLIAPGPAKVSVLVPVLFGLVVPGPEPADVPPMPPVMFNALLPVVAT